MENCENVLNGGFKAFLDLRFEIFKKQRKKSQKFISVERWTKLLYDVISFRVFMQLYDKSVSEREIYGEQTVQWIYINLWKCYMFAFMYVSIIEWIM